jgi:nicotinate phosphoribosyltransferase
MLRWVGIYKLGAVRRPGDRWQYRIKLSDEPAKTSYPGVLQVRRFCQPEGRFIADTIYEIDHGVSEPCEIVDLETGEKTEIPATTDYSDLLVAVFRKGQLVYQAPQIDEARERARKQLSYAPAEIVRLEHPTNYKIGLEQSLHELRSALIARAQKL